MVFLWATVIVVLQKKEAGIYSSPSIELDYRYRKAPLDIALDIKTKILNSIDKANLETFIIKANKHMVAKTNCT